MTLDEIQNLAVCQVDTIDPDAGVLVADVLAEAVLLMLPVVKAAEEWRDQHRRRWEQTERRSPDPLYVRVPDDVLDLADAIDAMRKRMGEK